VPSDDVDNSKVVKDVHSHSEIPNSEISSVVEDPLVNPATPIIDESHVSSAGTSDVVKVLVDSSTPIPDEAYVHEDNQESQETKSESIVATPSVSSFTKSLKFLDMVYQVSSSASSFSKCLSSFQNFSDFYQS